MFGPPPNPFSQRQNIFVRVFSWTWISRPMTGSHSGMRRNSFAFEQRHLDVAAHLEDRRGTPRARRACGSGRARARRPRATDARRRAARRASRRAPRALAEDPLDGEDEVGGTVDECLLHRMRSGTVSKPIARSSACPARNNVFSENCGPISCSPDRAALPRARTESTARAAPPCSAESSGRRRGTSRAGSRSSRRA